jgi:hypothetical protein
MAPPSELEGISSSSRVEKDTVTPMNDVEPSHAVSAEPKQKEPPREAQDSMRIRHLVMASFWAIVLFLGLPIWWSTTAIYRASLPLDQMMDWADGKVSCLVVYVSLTSWLTSLGLPSCLPSADIH